MDIIGSLLYLIIVIGGIIGIYFLQKHLVKKETKWLGWILPGICFLLSISVLFGSMAFTAVSTTTLIDDQGNVIEEKEKQKDSNMDLGSVIYIFILFNIPTAIFSMMCIQEHKKDHKKEQIYKMNIQDL